MQEIDEIIDEIIKLGLDENEIELLFKKLRLVKRIKNIKEDLDIILRENSLESVEEHFEILENYLKDIVEKGIDNVENIFSLKQETSKNSEKKVNILFNIKKNSKGGEKMDYKAFYLIKEGYGDYTNNQANWTSISKLIKGKSSRCNSFKTEEETKYFISKKGLVTKEKMKVFMQNIKNEKEVEKIGIKEEILIFLDPNSIYCDGTVANGKAKARVTDANRNSLIKEILLTDEKFNEFLEFKKWDYDDRINCNIQFDKIEDVAFGETFALYLGMEIALRKGFKTVYSDCINAIENWSLGKASAKGYERAELLVAITDKRKEFEKKGGTIKHIAGEINPADFGLHPIPNNVRFTSKMVEGAISIEEYYNMKRELAKEEKAKK